MSDFLNQLLLNGNNLALLGAALAASLAGMEAPRALAL